MNDVNTCSLIVCMNVFFQVINMYGELIMDATNHKV